MQLLEFQGKTKNFFIKYFCALCLLFLNVNIQKAQTTSINQGTLNDKFDYIIKNSEVINDTRIIKNWWIFTLRNSVNDTLKMLKEKITDYERKIAINKVQIDSLSNLLSQKSNYLNELETKQNSISFFGKDISKEKYNSIMLSFIIFLVLLLLFVFFLFKRSNSVAIRIQKDLDELREEFENYRKRTLEREQKIVREMYDEILKYKNKLNEITKK